MNDPHPNEGREVSQILWPSDPDGSFRSIKSGARSQLRFHSEYLGDHSENWIVEISGGIEISRHNTRFIESIVWIES